jgi:hypothetical protein
MPKKLTVVIGLILLLPLSGCGTKSTNGKSAHPDIPVADDLACYSYGLSACLEACGVCPPCETCTVLACQNAQTCVNRGFTKSAQAAFRSPSIGFSLSSQGSTFPFAYWNEVKALLQAGEVKSVTQSDELDVTISLQSGTTYTATEPFYDAILEAIDQCGTDCSGLRVTSK